MEHHFIVLWQDDDNFRVKVALTKKQDFSRYHKPTLVGYYKVWRIFQDTTLTNSLASKCYHTPTFSISFIYAFHAFHPLPSPYKGGMYLWHPQVLWIFLPNPPPLPCHLRNHATSLSFTFLLGPLSPTHCKRHMCMLLPKSAHALTILLFSCGRYGRSRPQKSIMSLWIHYQSYWRHLRFVVLTLPLNLSWAFWHYSNYKFSRRQEVFWNEHYCNDDLHNL